MIDSFWDYFWVGIGGALGTLARFWVGGAVARRWGEAFPLGTLAINVTGSFIITFFDTLTSPDGNWMAPRRGRAFFMTGVCGGYTTFSSFSLQTLNLALDGEWLYAGANAGLSLTLCLLAAWLGRLAALSLRGTKGT
ncbi:MAG TPA: fluoride efflux transporter CrcB [Verrucomicrobiae bacterium]|jgi:CrcB protein